MSCAICEKRKAKRFCPAVHGRICPQCCGEQREVTLDCPSDCPYLRQAREHEKPRASDQIDPAGLFLDVEVSDIAISNSNLTHDRSMSLKLLELASFS